MERTPAFCILDKGPIFVSSDRATAKNTSTLGYWGNELYGVDQSALFSLNRLDANILGRSVKSDRSSIIWNRFASTFAHCLKLSPFPIRIESERAKLLHLNKSKLGIYKLQTSENSNKRRESFWKQRLHLYLCETYVYNARYVYLSSGGRPAISLKIGTK